MACLLTAKSRPARGRRGWIHLGLSLLSLVVLASSAAADRNPFGPRAGSNFSGVPNQYGQVSRRPYRRQQPPVAQPVTTVDPSFDYRFETAADADVEALAAFQAESLQPVGYCDCVGDCTCGNCVEADCGCEDYCEPECGCDDYCEPECGCDDICSGCDDGCCTSSVLTCAPSGPMWMAGFEWTFVKPRFSENVAFTTMASDGNDNDIFVDTEFDYELELTPRVWIEAGLSDNWSWRVSWWQFDHAPGALATSPNANFGRISPPDFGERDFSTTIATDTFFAASRLNAYTIDFEGLKKAQVGGWHLGVGGGVRYASVQQAYYSRLQNNLGNIIGQIDFDHKLEGAGPTMLLSVRRPCWRRVRLAAAARGSILFGDGTSRLFSTEDTTPSTTLRFRGRDDLLPIGEARVGLEWTSPRNRGSGQFLISAATEGQIGGNAGNASSETADLGFYGFSFGAGWAR
ncbi:MAG: Lpg1974 family pore-forming outer membrane protein [Bythopirellula sp.]